MITNLSTCPMLLTPLLLGWLLDLILGDPAWLPHPVVGFGKMISFGEKRLNRGTHRRFKGAFLALFLALSFFIPQDFTPLIYPLALLLLSRALVHLAIQRITR